MVHTTQAHLDKNSPLLGLSLCLGVGGDLVELLVNGAQSAAVGQDDLKPLDMESEEAVTGDIPICRKNSFIYYTIHVRKTVLVE